MKDRLEYIHTTVNDWMKYAEAKHGGLLAINSFVLYKALPFFDQLGPGLEWMFYVGMLGFSGAILASLVSFMPVTRFERMLKTVPVKAQGYNFISTRNLAAIQPDELVKVLYVKQRLNPDDSTLLELHYAETIVATARITLKKFRCFNLSLGFMMVGTVTFMGMIFLTH